MTEPSDIINLHDHPRWRILHQLERCITRARKTRVGAEEDLRARVADCLRRMTAQTVGGIEGAAAQMGIDPRTLAGWCLGTTLPRLADAIRVARYHPPLADLLAREMGLRVDGLTAQEIAALRALLPAARVVERLVEPDQADLFAG